MAGLSPFFVAFRVHTEAQVPHSLFFSNLIIIIIHIFCLLYNSGIFQSFVAQDQPAHEPRATPVLDLDTNIGQSIHAARTETRSNFSVQQTTSAVGPLLTETRISAAVQQEPAAVDLTHTETRLNVSVQQATSSVHNLEVKRRQTTLPWLQTPANDTVVCEGSPPKISTSTFGSSCTQQRVVEQTTTHDSLAQAPGAGMSFFLILLCGGVRIFRGLSVLEACLAAHVQSYFLITRNSFRVGTLW